MIFVTPSSVGMQAVAEDIVDPLGCRLLADLALGAVGEVRDRLVGEQQLEAAIHGMHLAGTGMEEDLGAFFAPTQQAHMRLVADLLHVSTPLRNKWLW